MVDLSKNYPLHANDKVYLYNTETREFLSNTTTEHLERISGVQQPFLQGTTDKNEAMSFQLSLCLNMRASTINIHTHDEVVFYSLSPGMEGRMLEFSTISARSGSTFQQALENGLVHKPRTYLTLGNPNLGEIKHAGIFSLYSSDFFVNPLKPVSAYEPVTIVNVKADEPVLLPKNYNIVNYVIEPNDLISSTNIVPIYGDYDKFANSAQWILYPTTYYSVDQCKVPDVQKYVAPSGLDTHGNPVFRSAELCREYVFQHPELIPVTGFTRITKGSRVPWWMSGNYNMDTRIPIDMCLSESNHQLPEYDSAGACFAAGLPSASSTVSSSLGSTTSAPPPNGQVSDVGRLTASNQKVLSNTSNGDETNDAMMYLLLQDDSNFIILGALCLLLLIFLFVELINRIRQ
jgi:hypothetical protein